MKVTEDIFTMSIMMENKTTCSNNLKHVFGEYQSVLCVCLKNILDKQQLFFFLSKADIFVIFNLMYCKSYLYN